MIDTAGTYNFTDCTFDGSGTNEVETTHASGTVTINLSGVTVTSGGFGVTETGAGAVVVNNNVTVTVNVKDNTGANLQNARVLVEADTGGPAGFPSDASVTITRSGSTASVSHTAHGMADGDTVIIRGSNQIEYNGIFTITNTTTNAYDYTVTGTPDTPATGTITCTREINNGLTNASGDLTTTTFNYTADVPIRGLARKSSASPRFKTFSFTGTISSTGFSNSVRLILDE